MVYRRTSFKKYTVIEARIVFWSRVQKSDGCWLWVGGTNAHGYGSFTAARRCGLSKTDLAHRISYESVKGPIPCGLELHHRETCPKNCVNPEHLTLTTRKDHPGSAPDVQRKKTHCPFGHEYTAENTHKYNGSRFCRRCHKIANRVHRSELREHRMMEL